MEKTSVMIAVAMAWMSTDSLAQVVVENDPKTAVREGFSIRGSLGFAYTDWREDMRLEDEVKTSGAGLMLRAQFGGCVSRDFLLHVEFGVHNILGPAFEGSTQSQRFDGSKLVITEYGGGLRYYFMPQNIYLSFSVLLSITHNSEHHQDGPFSDYIEYPNGVGGSDIGAGFFASVGKEWFVYDNVAYGVEVFGYYGNMKDKGDFLGNSISTYSAGALFGITKYIN
jgi:hypothetical protein